MKYYHLDWHKHQELQGLADLSQPPKDLFFIGQYNPELFKNCVAVVGSRRITTYGRQAIDKLIPQLIYQGSTIISGFMYGVDQYAHRSCIESGGKTVAVLGWGIANQLDDDQIRLAHQIIDHGGLLISEWENQPATLWTFPVRNRIVAALSQAVYVIEAAAKSGSLLTAEAALKLKRQLWAIPGPITSQTSVGTNRLIIEAKAKAWLGQIVNPSTTPNQDPLVTILQDEPLSADELSAKLNQPIAVIGSKLSLLALSGQLVEQEGKYYPKPC